jgi:hypothetical protein
MFNTIKNLSIQEKIEHCKKGLEQFEHEVRELILGPCTTATREGALLLHARTYLLYSKLEKLEKSVFHFVDDVEDILADSMELSLMFNGEFMFLKHFGGRPRDGKGGQV